MKKDKTLKQIDRASRVAEKKIESIKRRAELHVHHSHPCGVLSSAYYFHLLNEQARFIYKLNQGVKK